MNLLLALLLAASGTDVRICDKADATKCASVGADGKVAVGATVNVAGAADTVGNPATFSANAVCATVLVTGQPGAGFFLGAGTLAATLTPSISVDATPAAPGCTGGNYTPSKFIIDVNGNTSPTLVLTNPNAFQHVGIATLSATRCVQVCTTSFSGGSAVGFLVATVAQSPPPAPSADVTDRSGRILGHVTVDSAPTTPVTGPLTDAQLRASAVPVSAASLPLPSNAAKETGGNLDSLVAKDFATQTTLAQIKTDVDKIPSSPSTDRTTAAAPFAVELSDGAAFYKGTTPTDTQPVSAASLPLPAGASTSANQTNGTQKAIVRGGAKGATAAADITSTPSGADHQPADVILYDAAGSALDPRTRTWSLSSGTDSVNVGNFPATYDVSDRSARQLGKVYGSDGNPIATANGGRPQVDIITGAGGTSDVAANLSASELATTRAASTAALRLWDWMQQPGAQLVPWSGSAGGGAQVQVTNRETTNLLIRGAPPSPTNPLPVQFSNGLGSQTGPLPVTVDPSWATVDPSYKAVHTTARPFEALGVYTVSGRTGTYNGLSGNAPLFSMRWGDATRLAVILKVSVAVVTTTAATAAGITERQLIIARNFTASDTGGTAVTLTGNNAKRRTSMGTSLVTNMQFGAPLSAGTRTLDSAPVASVIGWTGLLTTGVTIGATGATSDTVPASTVRFLHGGVGFVPLFDATNGQEQPIVLQQNEGVIVRLGNDTQPTSAVQETFVSITWGEINPPPRGNALY